MAPTHELWRSLFMENFSLNCVLRLFFLESKFGIFVFGFNESVVEVALYEKSQGQRQKEREREREE